MSPVIQWCNILCFPFQIKSIPTIQCMMDTKATITKRKGKSNHFSHAIHNLHNRNLSLWRRFQYGDLKYNAVCLIPLWSEFLHYSVEANWTKSCKKRTFLPVSFDNGHCECGPLRKKVLSFSPYVDEKIMTLCLAIMHFKRGILFRSVVSYFRMIQTFYQNFHKVYSVTEHYLDLDIAGICRPYLHYRSMVLLLQANISLFLPIQC